MLKLISLFALNLIFLGSLIAQPKPTYQSSTAYIIWYDAQQRDKNINSSQSSGSSGGSSGDGSGGIRMTRATKRLDRYLKDAAERQAAKEDLKELNSRAEYEFWNAANYFDHGQFDSAAMAYQQYSDLNAKQGEYSRKNNVALDMYDDKGIARFDDHRYYDFMINYRLQNYERAFDNYSFLLPVHDPDPDYMDFPAGTVKVYRHLKQVTTQYIVPCLYFVTALGQMNICKDGNDILNKLPAAIKDSIQADHVAMLDYAMALASVRNYNSAIKIFNEVITEAKNPNLTFAIAKDLNRMLSNNPTHEKQIVDYTFSLFDAVITSSGDGELTQQSKKEKDELTNLFRSGKSLERYKEILSRGYADEGLDYYKKGDYKNGIKCMNKYFKKKQSKSGGLLMTNELDGSWPVYCQMKMLLATGQDAEACALWKEVYKNAAWMIMNSSLTTINSFLTVDDMTRLMNGVAQ